MSEVIQSQATAEQPTSAYVGWLLALVVPFVTYLGLIEFGVTPESAIFLAIVSLPIVMWPFSILPDFVPGLLAVVLILIVGAAPPQVVLGGFSSIGFLMIISILGLGALIRNSGLVNRLATWMINGLPGNVLAYALALFCGGLLLTPFLPSPAGRLSVTAPLVRQLEKKIGSQFSRKGRSFIFLVGLDGVTLLTASFLTAAPVNLIIFSLLPQQERVAFQFVDWIIASAVAAGVMVAGYLVLASIVAFDASRIAKPDHSNPAAPQSAQERDALAGDTDVAPRPHAVIPERLSRREWGAITAIVALGIGVLTTPIHLIPTPVLAFLIFALLFAVQIMEQPDFVAEIDWAFIFLLGALVGMTNTMEHLGITAQLVAEAQWLGDILRDDFRLFVLIIAGVIVTTRLVVPQTATTLVLVAALLPLAEAVGVTAWVVGFTILIMTDSVTFDYQSPMHRKYRQGVEMGDGIDNWRIGTIRVLMIGVRIAAVLISIPYWQKLGVL